MVKVTYKGETRDIPERYLKDLKGAERRAQIKSIFEKTDRPKTSAKSKKSTWTEKFDKKYGDKLGDSRSLSRIAKVTGIPFAALKKVYEKGLGAYYSGGSRPNMTAPQWAKARVFSYIMGGPTREVDKHITEEYDVKFSSG